MTSFEGIVSRQVESLTRVLRERSERRCREIHQEAKRRADALLAQTRREARMRVHQAVLEERRRRKSDIVEARHRVGTEARRQLQDHYQELIDRGWPLLARELAARWAKNRTRTEWCALLVGEAEHLLGKDGWLVEHPDPETGAWSRNDRTQLEELLAARGIAPPGFQPDASLEAGLRIRRAGACLDGTTRGLLARRAAVVGRLLALWETAALHATQAQGVADG